MEPTRLISPVYQDPLSPYAIKPDEDSQQLTNKYYTPPNKYLNSNQQYPIPKPINPSLNSNEYYSHQTLNQINPDVFKQPKTNILEMEKGTISKILFFIGFCCYFVWIINALTYIQSQDVEAKRYAKYSVYGIVIVACSILIIFFIALITLDLWC